MGQEGNESLALEVLQFIRKEELANRRKGKHKTGAEGNGLKPRILTLGSLFHLPLTLLATV